MVLQSTCTLIRTKRKSLPKVWLLSSIKYTPKELFIHEGKLYAYFIGKNPKTAVTTLYIQQFSEKLEQIGKTIEITSIPDAMDGNEFRKMAMAPLVGSGSSKYQNIEIAINELSGTMIFTFSLKSKDEMKISYAKVFVVDKDFKLINSKEYKAKDPKNTIKIQLHKIYPNNDAFFSISEGIKKSKEYVISSNAMIFVPGNDEEISELPLVPSQKKIRKTIVSSNFDAENTYAYAIQSDNDDENLAQVKIYTFNPNSEKETEIVVDISKFFKKTKGVELYYFEIFKLYILENKTFLIHMESSNSGSFVFNVDTEGKVLWSSKVRNRTSTIMYDGAFGYLAADNTYKIIFNTNLLDGSSLIEKTEKISAKSTPTICTINLGTGKSSYKAMNNKGHELGAICPQLSKEISNGVFLFRLKYDGKIQSVPVDFNK